MVVYVRVTIPYSSGDFFGLDEGEGSRLGVVQVTIPYSSGDFFGLLFAYRDG